MRQALSVCAGMAVVAQVWAGSIAKEVNCFLGTEGTGHTFPAAAYPFGLVQAGPDTGWGTWEYCSGYQYRDRQITMFSQTHNSGGGCSDYADIGIMPVTGKVALPVQIAATEKGKGSTTSVARAYDKTSECAQPGYYAVTLADGIRVEATASELCAVYRITYPQGVTPCLLVDLDYGMEGNPAIGYGQRKRTTTKSAAWHDGALLAHIVKNGFVPDRQIGVAMRFEPKPAAVEELPRQAGDHAPQYVVDFDLAANRTLVVRIGLSTASAAGAARNLERQVAASDFDALRRAASDKWETVLSRIRLEGGDRDTRVNFATAVYRMFLQPQNVADADAPEPYYSEFSLWDTFRGAHPLYTLAAKEYVPKFVNSLVEHQERFGYLPVLPKWGRDTQCMIGTHAVSVIAEAYFKGFRGVDWERAYRSVKDTLTKPHEGRFKENWDLYDRYGYYPFDKIRGESVSRTLECSYDDWCAMRMAEALGHAQDAAFFRRRANCWTNVFDRSIGFVRGKDTKGAWRTPFDPYRLGHGAGTANDFTEGNAFQYTWHVLQDPEGLMDLMGGRQAFVRKLDELFAAKDKVEGEGCVVDVTGLIGQYAHGNEPSHHIAYLYQYAGRGDRTAEKVREICRRFYRNAPDGLCGNEDHGEMSAWYVFACMGFYPVSPASGDYVLGAPQVPAVSVDVGGGKVFRVIAKGLSEEAKYVKSVCLNGRPLKGFLLRHSDIENGGELVFEMAVANFAEIGPEECRPLRRELRAFHPDECHQECKDAAVLASYAKMRTELDAWAKAHSGWDALDLRREYYGILVRNFKPVLFRESPFYFEAGVNGGWTRKCPGKIASDLAWAELDDGQLIHREARARVNERNRQRYSLVCGPLVDGVHHLPPFRTIFTKGFKGVRTEVADALKTCPAWDKAGRKELETALVGLDAVHAIQLKFREAAFAALP